MVFKLRSPAKAIVNGTSYPLRATLIRRSDSQWAVECWLSRRVGGSNIAAVGPPKGTALEKIKGLIAKKFEVSPDDVALKDARWIDG